MQMKEALFWYPEVYADYTNDDDTSATPRRRAARIIEGLENLTNVMIVELGKTKRQFVFDDGSKYIVGQTRIHMCLGGCNDSLICSNCEVLPSHDVKYMEKLAERSELWW